MAVNACNSQGTAGNIAFSNGMFWTISRSVKEENVIDLFQPFISKEMIDNTAEYREGTSIKYFGGTVISSDLGKNVNRVRSFAGLKDGWDGETGKKFSIVFLDSIVDLLKKLTDQPEVFPISDGSIQLEYETEQGDYLEFEISEEKSVTMFCLDLEGNSTQRVFEFDADKINKQVAQFYGR